MPAGKRRKLGFGCTPKKGTMLREFLRLAMRPCGISCAEAAAIGIAKTGNVGSTVENLRSQKGWDVRTFRAPHLRDPSKKAGRCPVVHKVVGRMRWDGSYRSFTINKRGDDNAEA